VRRAILEWALVAAVFALAAAARYLLVQPPEVAQACEAAAASGWCPVRMLVIRSFSSFGLGYAAMAAIVLTLFTWSRVVAWIAAMIGAAGLILYCFEPAAVSFVTGALVLARAQSGLARPSTRRHEQHT
jgi:DNA-binding LytR/AlgR family response regulator